MGRAKSLLQTEAFDVNSICMCACCQRAYQLADLSHHVMCCFPEAMQIWVRVIQAER